MDNLKYGGIYWNNINDIGNIYLRFFRNGTVSYLITTDIEIEDKIFNQLQKNFNNNIDIVKYQINNDDIKFIVNINKSILQFFGKVNNDSILLSIVNSTTKTDVVFSYYKKQYLNISDKKINTQPQKVKTKNNKMKENEWKTKEKIPGGPKMARSFNGFSYRSIARWR